MTTLLELKSKYTAEQAAREAKRAAEVVTLFPGICSWLAQREGVDIDELVQYGRLEGDWYSSGDLRAVIFCLELPEHEQISTRIRNIGYLDEEKDLDWTPGPNSYNRHSRLAPALIEAAETYQKRAEAEQQEAHEAEEYQIQQVLKAHEAKRVESEKQRLFDQVAGNPAALLLLKLFVQIQKDADAFDGQINSLEEARASDSYYHDEQCR